MEPVNFAVAAYICGIMIVLGAICVYGSIKNSVKQ